MYHVQRFAVADRGGWLPPPDALQAATAAGSEQAGALQVGPCRHPHTFKGFAKVSTEKRAAVLMLMVKKLEEPLPNHRQITEYWSGRQWCQNTSYCVCEKKLRQTHIRMMHRHSNTT